MADKKPPKWTETYPQGTKEGSEERLFFIALSRHKEFVWRSVAALAEETKLSKARVQELCLKYHKKGMLFVSSKSKNWAYWENVPHLLKKENKISKKDLDDRIDKAMGI